MLKKENIICISSIDWDFVWQGHQEVMDIFAKNGNRVLFIENTGIRSPNFKDFPRLKKRFINWFKSIRGFREEKENLFVYSPVILPFPYSRIARWINKYMLLRPLKRWLKVTEFHRPIIWTFLPTGIALDIINNLDKKLLVYYCIADFYELVDKRRKVIKTENEIIRKSDIIFAQGEILAAKCRKLNNNVHVFPFGVKMEIFDNFDRKLAEVPDDIKNIKKPIIGYLGGIHRHIDFELIYFIAKSHPEWSIVLIGPQQTGISKINILHNVFFLGKKDFSVIPNYIKEFDVGIIPYQISDYTATVYPTKLNEYHAMGKPVVSTDLPEVVKFNIENEDLVLIGRTYAEFTDCISKALNDINEKSIHLRMASSKKNSWFNRIGEMSNLLYGALAKKSSEKIKWQELFIRLYRAWQKRTMVAAVAFITAYLLLFYTPFVWFMANYLKISHQPQKADSIVVFAGGVGESGKAGQGYEERVKYAVELYKQGYASHIVFSSGYIYVFEEPLLMKVLAVSLGVPGDAIILEDQSKNTYEHVKFTKEILDKNNWNKVLLVSSPYHMRRVLLVFNKVGSKIKVFFTPIPKSLFYSHPDNDENGNRIWKQINLQQIKGIVHEYLGILYYMSKGWI